jgi:L-cysteine:1D-myo-inositol 2-amino-2-deoxy-alpha-D-glucopyranoside ligase
MQIYNSMTRKKETFIAHGDQVGVYVCGIIPYEPTHIGHAFTYVHFDVLVRYLRHLGHQVVYVQKLTDIDDRILETAATLGADWQSVSERNTSRFLSDMHWLGNLAPTLLPRVTDLMPSIVEHIEKLIEMGCAERKNGTVYFISAPPSGFDPLGRSLRQDPKEKDPKASTARRKDPRDIVLWQSGRPGEPVWQSPWGMGRPGRHIECSTIAMKFLGPTIDIIGGSRNLIFPHHECIIAHAECLAGANPARHWVHTGQVTPAQGPAQHGSENVLFLSGMRDWDGLAIRAAVLDRHYADSWTFDPRDIRMGNETIELFRQACTRADGTGPALDVRPHEEGFIAAMNDNLDTPRALSALRRLAVEILRDAPTDVGPARTCLARALRVLGLDGMRLSPNPIDTGLNAGSPIVALKIIEGYDHESPA